MFDKLGTLETTDVIQRQFGVILWLQISHSFSASQLINEEDIKGLGFMIFKFLLPQKFNVLSTLYLLEWLMVDRSNYQQSGLGKSWEIIQD